MTAAPARPGGKDDPDTLYALAMRQRDADDRGAALANLERATTLAPPHAAIAHALAQTRLEAGLPAARHFERAIALAPGDASLRLGLVAARLAEGEGARALAELGALLGANAGWPQGHAAFARLSAVLGRGELALDSIAAAIAAAPDSPILVVQAIDLALAAEDYPGALEWARRGEGRFGASEAWTETRAIAHDELGEPEAAGAAFAALGEPDTAARAIRLVRHQIRNGAIVEARAIVERWLRREGGAALWPYAAMVWRIADPARADWFERGGSLAAVIDTGMRADEIERLAAHLRTLHAVSGQFADQSVRGGTQTDGPLLARIDPTITDLRARIKAAVADYIGHLPPSDPAHPTLGTRRDAPVRFAGSWSVRLEGAGRHVAHHHPMGWISSAFYVAVPAGLAPGEGVLELGRPPADLGVDLPPLATVVPQPGRLALFPSWMWHGTTPFRAGERMTAAFDIAPT